ncbi:MAG: hypothetical protein KIT09_08080 [Bryobacteraceae bacterium]|nr:hypothetical protein [Bryobacteraceae bacterium]
MRRCLFLILLASGALSGQTRLADSPKVVVKGVIAKVAIAPGQGMPSLELKTEEETRRVLLGSMRYLMENDFNPKAGATAVVKGFRLGDEIVAQEIEIPAEKIVLKLRADDGTPLWRRGPRRRGRGR